MGQVKKNNDNTKVRGIQTGTLSETAHPFRGILMITLGILFCVAFVDYHPAQNQWISTAARDNFQQNLVGNLGVLISFWMNYIWGLASWFFPALLLWTGYLLSFKKVYLLKWWKYTAMAGMLISCTILLKMTEGKLPFHPNVSDANFYPFGAGGFIGSTLYAHFFEKILGIFGSGLIFGTLYIICFLITFSKKRSPQETFESIYANIFPSIKKRFVNLLTSIKQFLTPNPKPKPIAKPATPAPKKNLIQPELIPATPTQVPVKELPKEELPAAEASKESGFKIISGEKLKKATVNLPTQRGDYIFPSTELLEDAPVVCENSEDEHKQIVDELIKTLAEFGVSVTPGEVHTGPVITRYEVIPAAGVRVEKIANLEKNIALSLRAYAVRILAPVPGKGTVGIEIPNRNPAAVCIKEIIESTAWSDSQAEIPIVLGKEVTGKPLVYDLTKMPHLLIAGSTGSGKTVCINTIIASLLYHASPEDLRFIMVDPKIVEMQLYNSLPHMLIPVMTDPKKVPSGLKWLIQEMERRYQIFAKAGVRNIAGFNAKVLKDKKEKEKAAALEALLSPEERSALNNAEVQVPRDDDLELPTHKLPYIVCIVDELADLMMVAPADIETCIARLAQLARAAGIHLIIATQRPSVNVITGVIKANLPCRIAFKVASKVDSRTILDGGGADQLIGRGDMLFIPPGGSEMLRAQGAYASDEEINKILDAIKVNGPPQYADAVQKEIEFIEDPDSEFEHYADKDEMMPAAINVLRNAKRASTSLLQRKLKIGYNRAARIMDLLEEEGIVGPENGQNPREILVDLDTM